MNEVRATVRVQVLVEVALGSVWGADCMLGQIHTQGTREAIAVVEKYLGASPKMRVLKTISCEVIVTGGGKP